MQERGGPRPVCPRTPGIPVGASLGCAPRCADPHVRESSDVLTSDRRVFTQVPSPGEPCWTQGPPAGCQDRESVAGVAPRGEGGAGCGGRVSRLRGQRQEVGALLVRLGLGHRSTGIGRRRGHQERGPRRPRDDPGLAICFTHRRGPEGVSEPRNDETPVANRGGLVTRPAGFEPATSSSGGTRSIQLS